jgi:Fur family ferric uptake transcriptional regulator
MCHHDDMDEDAKLQSIARDDKGNTIDRENSIGEYLKERIRAAGMRVTAPRLAVLAAVHNGAHLNADEIMVIARERLGSLSRQSVYDNLYALLDAGLVRRIEPANAPALYEARVGDNHHHLVCRECGRIEDVDCVVGHRPCLEPVTTHGFELDEAEVTFWGYCPACKAAIAQNPPPPQNQTLSRDQTDRNDNRQKTPRPRTIIYTP